MIATLVILFCLAVTCYAGRPDPEMDGAIDASVANLKKVISNRQALANSLGVTTAADDLWTASAYKNIGLMLQSKGIRQHLGGDRLQREALDNYDLALSIDKGRTPSLNVQILYLRGMLLKMMGLGQESLDSLAKLENDYRLSDHDKSALFFQRADTLQMLGRSKEASQNFRKSLQLRPCRTERYYQYVNACKDVPTFSKQDWLDVLDEIQRKLKACEAKMNAPEGDSRFKTLGMAGEANGDDSDEEDEDELAGLNLVAQTGTAVENDVKESFLIFDDHEKEDGISGVNSAVYWALYIAAENAGRSALAWWYLEHANSLEKSLRAVKFDPKDATTQATQVLSAFTPELLDSLAYMKGKASRVPIFIVGFMRYTKDALFVSYHCELYHLYPGYSMSRHHIAILLLYPLTNTAFSLSFPALSRVR
jgi:tetratricopeptide (TPR) repeat protein